MSGHTLLCLAVFLGLFIASMIMQWLRAAVRKELLKSVETGILDPDEQERWKSLDQGVDIIFRDFRKLQLVKRKLNRFSPEFNTEFDRYRYISRAEMTVTASMLVFGATAFLMCG